GYPFVTINWASGLDAKGRPIATPQPPGAPTYPGNQGATNWYSPSYSPRTGLFYLSTWEGYGNIFRKEPAEYKPGQFFLGGGVGAIKGADIPPTLQRGNTGSASGHGAVLAIDPATGMRKWAFNTTHVNVSGILTTATDLLFVGSREGYFHALDARTGTVLWKASLGGETNAAPITWEADGPRNAATPAGTSPSPLAPPNYRLFPAIFYSGLSR